MPELPELNPVIHGKLRLALLSLLSGVDEAEFTWLRAKTGSTDGNLGAQLMKLEEAGYVAVEKKFVQRKPQSLYRMTEAGRAALREYVQALRELLGGNDQWSVISGRGARRFEERGADALHDAEVIGEIVDGVQRAGERFACVHQMAEIGARVAAADRAIASWVGRVLVFCVLLVLDVEAALAGEKQAVARGAGGQNAVHHVDAHARILLDFVGIADAHHVARLVFG